MSILHLWLYTYLIIVYIYKKKTLYNNYKNVGAQKKKQKIINNINL